MRKNTFFIAAILFLTIFLATFSIYLLRYNLKLKSELSSLRNGACELLRTENLLLKEGFFHSYDFSFFHLNLSKPIYNKSSDSTSILLQSKDKTTLVLLYNAKGCGTCFQEHVGMVESISAIKNIETLIGVEGLNERDFKIFIDQHGLSENTYRLPNDFYEGFQNSSIIYFLVHKGKAVCFYAPSDSFPSLTTDYYDKIDNIVKYMVH